MFRSDPATLSKERRSQGPIFNFQFSIFNSSVVTGGTELTPTHPRSRPLTSMPKNQIEPTAEVRSGFFERRRLRRIRMIVELTLNLVGSDVTVSHHEARS